MMNLNPKWWIWILNDESESQMMNLNSKQWIWIVTGMNPMAPHTFLYLAMMQALLVNKLRSLSSICCRWNVCLGSMGIAHTTLMCKGLSKHALVQIECVDNLKICSSQFALAWKREVCLSFSMSTVHEICTNMQVHVLIRANLLGFKTQPPHCAVLSFIYHYSCVLLFRFIVYDDSGKRWIWMGNDESES
jgi:hypothetical protein